METSAAGSDSARVGPNAIVRVAEALDERLGASAMAEVFRCAGLTGYLEAPPGSMVDEREAARLFDTVYRSLPREDADAVMHRAGVLTAEYLLANRIPRPVQAVLKVLPAPLSGRALIAAIRGNAWTFAGSGTFRAAGGKRGEIEIAANPLRAPGCVWHVAVFETLLTALVHRKIRVVHGHPAPGGEICRFEFGVDAAARRGADRPLDAPLH